MSRTEVISIASGKGGAGKTIVASCLGYALIKAGHRVLMVDGDRGTQGLSLFLLGNNGHERIKDIDEQDTLIAQLKKFNTTKGQPRKVSSYPLDRPDHGGIRYNTVVSDRSAYGDVPYASTNVFSTEEYCRGMRKFVEAARKSGEYDYVIIDTRGGFSSESTEVAALSDSIVVVTEPDYTSFFQIKNLLREISNSAGDLNRSPVVRGVLVNRATAVTSLANASDPKAVDLEQIEANYRLSISDQSTDYPIDYRMTHPLPSDIAVVDCYRTQRIPLHDAIGSPFSFAIYTAFTEIMRVVTAKWTTEQVSAWSKLSDQMNEENRKKQKEYDAALKREAARENALKEEAERARILERELAAVRENVSTLKSIASESRSGSRDSEQIRELMEEMRYRQRDLEERAFMVQRENHPKRNLNLAIAVMAIVIAVIVAFWSFYQSSNSNNETAILQERLLVQQDKYEIQLEQLMKSLTVLQESVLQGQQN